MVESLNVIALISGGKDSLYSILHCVHHGHKVVALANLQPSPASADISGQVSEATGESSTSDTNSFMFQTVGHSVIPLYSQALRTPLYRRTITGSAIVTDRDYSYVTYKAALDETEDLVPLLQEVMLAHPNANAIVTGAIQSTYQRTRIESVALRLGLVPLSFLWQYPVLPPPPNRNDSLTGLLDDMACVGCDARIIKIASGGIPERLLWANVADSRTRNALVRGLTPFFDSDELGLRGAVVGEGGEFETIALDGPPAVWKAGCITVDVNEAYPLTGEGGTSYANITKARLVERHSRTNESEQNGTPGLEVPIPALLDHAFEFIEDKILQATKSSHHLQDSNSKSASISSAPSIVPRLQPKTIYNISRNTIQINNLNYRFANIAHDLDATPSAAVQMTNIASALPKLLSEIATKEGIDQTISANSIVHTTIILRSMDTFSTINPIYASLFSPEIPNPPARVTISAPLPDGIDVSISIILDSGPRQMRRGLHVQSRSYWAPANIGPYSQAIAVPLGEPSHRSVADDDSPSTKVEIVHVAGQIPLVPATMELLDGSFHRKALLSLQHLWRLGQERRVDAWGFGVAFLSDANTARVPQESISSEKIEGAAEMAAAAWDQRHHFRPREELAEASDDEIDVWQSRYNRSAHPAGPITAASIGQHLHILPFRNPNGQIIPPFLAAQVSSLPRNADVEWWSLGISQLTDMSNGHMNRPVTFRLESTDYDVKSTLQISTFPSRPECTTKLIAWLIKAPQSESVVKDAIRRFETVAEIIKHGAGTTDPARTNLVSGNVFVATHAEEMWAELSTAEVTATTSPSQTQVVQPVAAKMTDRLGDVVTVTYVHSLKGHGGHCSDMSEDEQMSSTPLLEDLAIAFLLRVETT